MKKVFINAPEQDYVLLRNVNLSETLIAALKDGNIYGFVAEIWDDYDSEQKIWALYNSSRGYMLNCKSLIELINAGEKAGLRFAILD